MTLEHSFPGLRSSPGGAIVAVADNLFDLTGPANAMTAEVLQNHARQIMEQIKAIDPGWRYDEIVPIDALGNPIQTVDGLSTKVNDLRFQRAVMVARLKGDYEPLQVETFRFVHQRADLAYDRGVALLQAGRLTPRLSNQEDALAAGPLGAETLLETKGGEPFTPKGFYGMFKRACIAADLAHCSPHGLRKSAARRCKDAGCSNEQGIAITGHKTEKEYLRYAGTGADLADEAMEMVLANRTLRVAKALSQTPVESA